MLEATWRDVKGQRGGDKCLTVGPLDCRNGEQDLGIIRGLVLYKVFGVSSFLCPSFSGAP